MRAYIDADVLIWHLRGAPQALAFLRSVRAKREYELWTGALQRAEVVFFMRESEVATTELFLAQLKTAPLDQEIVDAAAALYRKWHPSHGIEIGDAVLAATAMKTGGKVFTLNVKHFPMPDLVVERAW